MEIQERPRNWSRCPDPQGQVLTTQPCLSEWARKLQSSGVKTRFHNLPAQSLEKESDIKVDLKKKKREPLPALATRLPDDKAERC